MQRKLEFMKSENLFFDRNFLFKYWYEKYNKLSPIAMKFVSFEILMSWERFPTNLKLFGWDISELSQKCGVAVFFELSCFLFGMFSLLNCCVTFVVFLVDMISPWLQPLKLFLKFYAVQVFVKMSITLWLPILRILVIISSALLQWIGRLRISTRNP